MPGNPAFSRRWIVALVVVWLAVVAVGASVVLNYQNRPGRAGNPPRFWPPSAPVSPSGHAATLLMFAHPHCPCTRASIEELARLAARRQGRFEGRVYFLKPAGFADRWERTDLWRSADAIPGVRALTDEHGRLARLFGSETSGHVLLYDREGRLVFSGGITPSRGHQGESVGRTRLLALLDDRRVDTPTSRVFGCPLTLRQACNVSAGPTGSRCDP